eukprot:1890651-Amphidinium_carterae.1
MEFDARRDILRVRRDFHSSALLVPVRASEDNMREIFRFFLATDTKLSHMEGTVRTDLVPYPT